MLAESHWLANAELSTKTLSTSALSLMLVICDFVI